MAILLAHRSVTLQYPVDRPLRDLHPFGLKQGLQLARSPPMGHSLLQYPLLHPAWGAPWTVVGPLGLLPQTSKAPHFPVSPYPVMSRRSANPIPLAQLADGFLLTYRSRYKLNPLIHDSLYLPRHILHLLKRSFTTYRCVKDVMAQPVKDVMALYTSGASHTPEVSLNNRTTARLHVVTK